MAQRTLYKGAATTVIGFLIICVVTLTRKEDLNEANKMDVEVYSMEGRHLLQAREAEVMSVRFTN